MMPAAPLQVSARTWRRRCGGADDEVRPQQHGGAAGGRGGAVLDGAQQQVRGLSPHLGVARGGSVSRYSVSVPIGGIAAGW
jgi:hypothetical protein